MAKASLHKADGISRGCLFRKQWNGTEGQTAEITASPEERPAAMFRRVFELLPGCFPETGEAAFIRMNEDTGNDDGYLQTAAQQPLIGEDCIFPARKWCRSLPCPVPAGANAERIRCKGRAARPAACPDSRRVSLSRRLKCRQPVRKEEM